jgi:hypothetical protein
MRKSVSSFLLLALSNSIPSPQTKPAIAGIRVCNGGGRWLKLLSKQMTYFANITIVARKAVEKTVFFNNDLRTRFGLKLKREMKKKTIHFEVDLIFFIYIY